MTSSKCLANTIKIAFIIFAFTLSAICQNTTPSLLPTITYTAVNWNANPRNYSMLVDSIGNLTYQGIPNSSSQTGNPDQVVFLLTPATRDTIFNLVNRVHFPRDSRPIVNPDLPGSIITVELRTQDSDRQVTLRAPGTKPLQQLSSIFQKISSTIEFGRRLSNLQSSRNPALATELEQMQTANRQGHLLELQSVTPILTNIASDNTLQASVRQQAAQILKLSIPNLSSQNPH